MFIAISSYKSILLEYFALKNSFVLLSINRFLHFNQCNYSIIFMEKLYLTMKKFNVVCNLIYFISFLDLIFNLLIILVIMYDIAESSMKTVILYQ